jgi:hypothetical protein
VEPQGQGPTRRRTFHFPDDWPAELQLIDCARFTEWDWWRPYGRRLARAQGDVVVDLPDGQCLALAVAGGHLDLTPLQGVEPSSLEVLRVLSGSAVIRDLRPLRRLEGLRWLVLYADVLTYPALAHIRELRQLELLCIFTKRLTVASLMPLRHLTGLRALHFWTSPVTDDHLVHVESLQHVEHLDLWNARITDRGLRSLSVLRRLRMLWLDGTEVSDEGLRHLQGLPDCASFA